MELLVAGLKAQGLNDLAHAAYCCDTLEEFIQCMEIDIEDRRKALRIASFLIENE